MHGYVSIIAFHNEGDWWMDQWKRVSRTNRPISQIPNLSHIPPCIIQNGNVHITVLIGVLSNIWAGALWDLWHRSIVLPQSANHPVVQWHFELVKYFLAVTPNSGWHSNTIKSFSHEASFDLRLLLLPEISLHISVVTHVCVCMCVSIHVCASTLSLSAR